MAKVTTTKKRSYKNVLEKTTAFFTVLWSFSQKGRPLLYCCLFPAQNQIREVVIESRPVYFLWNKAKKLSRRKYNNVEKKFCPILIVLPIFPSFDSYLSISDGFCFPEGSMRQQHISALTAYKMKIEMIRMVTTTPTTTAMAISISGDKCSAKEGTKNMSKSAYFLVVSVVI